MGDVNLKRSVKMKNKVVEKIKQEMRNAELVNKIVAEEKEKRKKKLPFWNRFEGDLIKESEF